MGDLKRSFIRSLRIIPEKDKELAKSVWVDISTDYARYGKYVFAKLFEMQPTYKRFFWELIGNYEDPFLSPQFQKHMQQVLMPSFGGIFTNLDHPEAVYEVLKRTGRFHKMKELGIARHHVDALGLVVLTTVKQHLENFSEEKEQAVSKILTLLLELFSQALEGKIV